MVNKAILVGRLAEYPKYNYSGHQKEAVFPIRTTDWIPSGQSEYAKAPQYHRIIAYGRNAERCKSLVKGDLVYLEGSIQTSYFEYIDKENKAIGAFTAEIILKQIRRFPLAGRTT